MNNLIEILKLELVIARHGLEYKEGEPVVLVDSTVLN